MNTSRLLIILFSLIGVLAAHSASAQTLPDQFTIEGRLYNSGVALSGTVDIKFEVIDNSAGNTSCVLYREVHSNIDLGTVPATQGIFALKLGGGTTKLFSPARLSAVFSNGVVQNGDATSSNTQNCSFTPTANSQRLVKMYVSQNSGATWTYLGPDTAITTSPTAMVAETLQGRSPLDFLQVDTSLLHMNQADVKYVFNDSNYPRLKALADGTSTSYMPATPGAAVGFNNQRITNVATPTAATDAATKGYTDANIGGKTADVSGVDPAAGNGYTLIWDQATAKWTTGVMVDPNALPKAGGSMTGAINMGGFDILSTGHITMSPLKTITLGNLTTAQESTLVGTLTTLNKGATWYNSTTKQMMVWDGSTAVQQSLSGAAAGGDLTGTYPSPTIANNKITSAKVDSAGIGINKLVISDATTGNSLKFATCAVNEVLRYEGVNGWTCRDPSSIVTAPVVSVNNKTGAVVLNAFDLGLGTASMENVGTASGNVPQLDASGKIPTTLLYPTTYASINNAAGAYLTYKPNNVACNTNEVLKFNGTNWVCATDLDSGASGTAGGDLSGTFPNPTIGALKVDTGKIADGAVTGLKIANNTITPAKLYPSPSANQLLSTDGTGANFQPMTCTAGFTLQSNGTGWTCAGIGTVVGNTYLKVGGQVAGAALNVGPTDAQSFNLMTGGTARLTVDSSGNVGIGTTTVNSTLEVRGISTSTSGGIIGSNLTLWALPGAASSSSFTGANLQVNTGNNVSFTGTVTGSQSIASHGAPQTLTNAIGSFSQAEAGGAGNITNATGLDASVYASGGGTIANAIGVSASVAKFYGANTNGYGIKIGTIDATNKWSLYATDATAPSYFAGSVGIGTNNPARLLHVNGPMRITPAALPGTPAAGELAFDSAASNALKFYDGSAWQTVGTGTGSGDFLKNGSVAMTGNFNAGGNSVLGNTTASANLKLESTSNATKGYVNIQPNGGNATIGATTSASLMIDSYSTATGILGLSGTGAANPASAGMLILANNRATATVGDTTGTIEFGSNNNSAGFGRSVAQIKSSLEGAGGANGFGGNLILSTKLDNYGSGMAERMRISNAGNVGIGISSPARLLHVNGPMRITPTSLPGTPSAGDLTFDSTASNALKYYNGAAWVTVGSGGGDFMANGSVAMTGNFNAGGNKVLGNTTASANLILESTSSATKGYVNIQPNGGKVGIGTTAPFFDFDLMKADTSATMRVINTSSTVSQMPEVNVTNYSSGLGGYPNMSMVASRGTYAAPAAVQAGDVLGSLNAFGQYSGTSGNVGAGAVIEFDAAGNFASNSYPTNTVFYNHSGAAMVPTLILTYQGNIGVNTLTPKAKLDVIGHIGNSDVSAGNKPTLSSCGSSTINGNDTRGVVTLTSSFSACTITFRTPYASGVPPVCTVSHMTTGSLGIVGIVSISNTALVVNAGNLGNTDQFTYICLQ